MPAVIRASEQALEEQNDKAKLITEVGEFSEDFIFLNFKKYYLQVGSFLVTLIEGIREMHAEQWALRENEDERLRHCTWLNEPDFLTHFTTHVKNSFILYDDQPILTTLDRVFETFMSREVIKKVENFELFRTQPLHGGILYHSISLIKVRRMSTNTFSIITKKSFIKNLKFSQKFSSSTI